MQEQYAGRRDALGRRSRTNRHATGKRMSLRPCDLLWFEKLHHHGPLPTSYLLAFVQHLRADKGRALKRLADLFHEGGYLTRPRQQFDTIDARFNQLVYDLDESALVALREAGMRSDYAQRPYGSWKHECMVSCITASIELATLATPHLTYIPQHRILERADVPLRARVPFQDPATKRQECRELIPDAMFGIEYKVGSSARYRFFLVEADRNTEPNRSRRVDRKSTLRSVLQYREFIGRGRYKEHFSLTSGMSVLTVTTSRARMENMMALVSEIAPSGGNSYMLFQSVPAFGQYFKPPVPMTHMLSSPWQRAGHAVARIDQP